MHSYKRMLFHLLLLFLTCCHASFVEVNITGLGTVKGLREDFQGTDLDIYRSIPFAKPPVGNLRFTHPQPAEPWDGVLDATNYPYSCMAYKDEAFNNFPGVSMWNAVNKSEDCLYLSIWAPSDASKAPVPKAVLVWIYGGGFWSGSTTLDLHDGRALAATTDTIVVMMQYRLGPLGFLYLNNSLAPGNQGMMDQALAMQWVKDHIGDFGGDSNNITLFGESAGGTSVSYHLVSPVSMSLFNRALMMSGVVNCRYAYEEPENSKRRHLELVDLVGCDSKSSTADIMSCLKKADAQLLQDKIWETTGYNWLTPVAPTLDGTFLTKDPRKSVELGEFKQTDIMIGTTKDEGSYFYIYMAPELFNQSAANVSMTDARRDEIISITSMSTKPMISKAIDFEYRRFMDNNKMPSNIDVIDDVIGDADFICPSIKFANAYAKSNNTVYYYEFRHVGSQNPWPDFLGVMHSYEIDFFFGHPLNKGDQLNYTTVEEDFSKDILSYFRSFAKTGNPNLNPLHSGLASWEPYTLESRKYIKLETGKDYSMDDNLRRDYCRFWDYYIPRLTEALEQNCTTSPDKESPETKPNEGCRLVYSLFLLILACISLI